jgi:DNA-binding transcriptional ArsR family regulator
MRKVGLTLWLVPDRPDPLGAVLSALADPSRRALLQRLAHGPATSGQLAELLPTMSRPAASQHLRVLADAGLLRTTIRGRRHWHELSIARLSEVEQWIRTLVGIWTAAPTLTPTLTEGAPCPHPSATSSSTPPT